MAAFLVSGALLAVGLPARAQQKPAGPQSPDEADAIYPKAYVCKDIQQNQIDDKPGKCKSDNTDLVEIRLGTAYKCLRGPAEIQATEGPCRTDNNRPKGAVTASVFWTCKNEGDKRYPDPGKCADGSSREMGFEERPHGDHNPRHGGLAIFMSPDLFYHVEGTYSANGVFRAYFYNEFTKPLRVTGITGQIALENSNFVARPERITLTPSPIADGNALEARIPNAPIPSKASNVFVKLYIKLKPNAPDWITDHQFLDYSKDPAPPAPAASPTGAARANQPSSTGRGTAPNTARGTQAPAPARGTQLSGTTPAGRSAAPSTTARNNPPPSAPNPPAPAPPAAPAAAAPAQEASAPPSTVMAGGAEVGGGPTGPQVVLPEKTPDLLAFLKENGASVKQLLDEGQLGGMWYPALNAKDAGLALDANHHEGLNDAQRARLASEVKQLTVVAWQIDAAGDLGNRTQLDQLTSQFETTVANILSIYGR